MKTILFTILAFVCGCATTQLPLRTGMTQEEVVQKMGKPDWSFQSQGYEQYFYEANDTHNRTWPVWMFFAHRKLASFGQDGNWVLETDCLFQNCNRMPATLIPIVGDRGELKTGLNNWTCTYLKSHIPKDGRDIAQMNFKCISKDNGYVVESAAICSESAKNQFTGQEGGFRLSDTKGANPRIVLMTCEER